MALDLISTIQAFMWKRDLPPIDLHLIFEELSLKTEKLNELDFYCMCSLQNSSLK